MKCKLSKTFAISCCIRPWGNCRNGTVLEIFTNPKEPITKEFMSVLSSNELPAAYRNGKVHKEYIKDATMVTSLDF